MVIRGYIMKKRIMMVVALVFLMVVSGEVWGISAASAAPSAKPRTLRMVMTSEPPLDHLHPLAGSTGIDIGSTIISNVMEPLVDVGKGGKPIPKLATKWEQSADFTKCRFYLRRGVKFHNGDNFTARDVVELAKWSLEEKKLSRLYQRVPIKEAIALDDYTVDLIFEKPQPLLLIMIRQFLIPPAAISRDNRKMGGQHPLGTGAYKFAAWEKGNYIKLSKFENYWGLKPQIDEAVITFRAEVGVRLATLMAGEADWVQAIGPEQADRAPKIVRMPSPETVWLKFDEAIQKEFGGESILADKRLRQAIDYAIDRKALVALYGGFVTPSLGQFASPGDFGFNPNLKNHPYDLGKAIALVREAGAVGKTVTLVGTPDRWTKDREAAEAVAYMIEQTGIKVKLMLMPHSEATKYKKALGENRKLKADIVLSPTDALLEVEYRFSYLFVDGDEFCATPDPESTRLYKEVTAEADYVKRGEKLGKAWAYAYEQVHYVPLYKIEWIWGVSKNLQWDPDIAGRSFIADMRFTN